MKKQHIQKIFFQGLLTFLPMAVTIYIVYAGVLIVDNLLGNALRQLLPVYIPGLGFILTIIIIFLFGLLLNNFITAQVLQRLEKRFNAVPFVKAIYSPLKDLMNLFQKGGPKGMKGVVLVDIGDTGIQAMGIVTREVFNDLPTIEKNIHDKVAVYMPFSYGLGGYTMLIPKNKLTAVDIPVEKAMSLAITGWVKAEKHHHESEQNHE